MARGIQLHCNRHMAIDVPVCVDWFLTFQRDKMSFLERSQSLGAFQNCFCVCCVARTREIPSAKKKKDGAALTARESACEERNRLKVSLLSRVLRISSMRHPAKQVRWNHAPFNTCHVINFGGQRLFWGEIRTGLAGENIRFSTLFAGGYVSRGGNVPAAKSAEKRMFSQARTGSSILGYAWV